MAVAAPRGARGKGAEISRELVKRLSALGLTASSLEESDSDPRFLDAIRLATGADAIVFLSLDADWSAFETSVLDARTGDSTLHSTVRARGGAFASASEIADSAARALSSLAGRRRAPKASRAPGEPLEEIPLP